MTKRERDVVESLHQALSRVVVDFERDGAPVKAHLSALEVDLDLKARVSLNGLPEILDLLGEAYEHAGE